MGRRGIAPVNSSDATPVRRRQRRPAVDDAPDTAEPDTTEPERDLPAGHTNPHDEPYTEGLIKRLLARADSKPERSRIGRGYTHVSNLIGGLCPRQFRIMDEKNSPDLRSVTGAHRVMWALGRAAERHARETLIKGCNRAGMYGIWSCRCGQVTTAPGFYNDSIKACSICKRKPGFYKEATLWAYDDQVVGNPDVIWCDKNNTYYPIEIKSMTGEKWKDLDAPKGDHVFQAACYRELLRRSGFSVGNKVIMLYTSKHFYYGSPYKEYAIDVSGDQWRLRISLAFDAARALRDSRRREDMPSRLCEVQTDRRAKDCPCLVECFGRGDE